MYRNDSVLMRLKSLTAIVVRSRKAIDDIVLVFPKTKVVGSIPTLVRVFRCPCVRYFHQ